MMNHVTSFVWSVALSFIVGCGGNHSAEKAAAEKAAAEKATAEKATAEKAAAEKAAAEKAAAEKTVAVTACTNLCMATVKAGMAQESDCDECRNVKCAKCIVGTALNPASKSVSRNMVYIPASTYCSVQRNDCR